MMRALRAVHVGGVGACAAGALLADDEPLVAKVPHRFERVAEPEPVDDEPTDDDDEETD